MRVVKTLIPDWVDLIAPLLFRIRRIPPSVGLLFVRNVIAASITIVVLKQLALIALILQEFSAQEKLRSLMRRSILNFSGERR